MKNNFDINPDLFKNVVNSWKKFADDAVDAFRYMQEDLNKMNETLKNVTKEKEYKDAIQMEKIVAECFKIDATQVYEQEIRVIDLLTMFANNETLPKKILYNGKEWTNCSRTQKYLLYYSDITEQIFKLEMFNTPPGMTDQDMLNMTIKILEW